jgi:hypothetical protein
MRGTYSLVLDTILTFDSLNAGRLQKNKRRLRAVVSPARLAIE